MSNSDQPLGLGCSEGFGAAVPTVKVVEILPTKVWIESDMMGARHVVMHHQGYGEPFTYASFHYDYAYTSNGGTWDAAHRLALDLGATEPVEQRQRDFHFPTADELREQIKGMQGMLASLGRARGLPNGCPEYCWCGVPSVEAAEAMGAKGGQAGDGERLAFEAWMRGHCWALCATWDGKQYRSDAEQGGDVDPRAMRTRQLWAAWRDRAALARG